MICLPAYTFTGWGSLSDSFGEDTEDALALASSPMSKPGSSSASPQSFIVGGHNEMRDWSFVGSYEIGCSHPIDMSMIWGLQIRGEQ